MRANNIGTGQQAPTSTKQPESRPESVVQMTNVSMDTHASASGKPGASQRKTRGMRRRRDSAVPNVVTPQQTVPAEPEGADDVDESRLRQQFSSMGEVP